MHMKIRHPISIEFRVDGLHSFVFLNLLILFWIDEVEQNHHERTQKVNYDHGKWENIFCQHVSRVFFSFCPVSVLIIFAWKLEILKMQITQCFTFRGSVSVGAAICVSSIKFFFFCVGYFAADSIIAVLFVYSIWFIGEKKFVIYYFLIQFFSTHIDKRKTHPQYKHIYWEFVWFAMSNRAVFHYCPISNFFPLFVWLLEMNHFIMCIVHL